MGYKTKEARAAYKRMRYATDQAFREKELARSQKNHAKNPEPARLRAKASKARSKAKSES